MTGLVVVTLIPVALLLFCGGAIMIRAEWRRRHNEDFWL